MKQTNVLSLKLSPSDYEEFRFENTEKRSKATAKLLLCYGQFPEAESCP